MNWQMAQVVGIKTQGNLVSVSEDSGIIFRCPECNRVLRDGECATHGEQEGVQDIRLRLVIDDGRGKYLIAFEQTIYH